MGSSETRFGSLRPSPLSPASAPAVAVLPQSSRRELTQEDRQDSPVQGRVLHAEEPVHRGADRRVVRESEWEESTIAQVAKKHGITTTLSVALLGAGRRH